VLPGLQRRDGIHVEIHSQPMAQLIGHELGIDAGLAGETRMRAAQDLERHPFQSNRFSAVAESAIAMRCRVALGNLKPEFQQLSMDARRAPDGIGGSHGSDQLANLQIQPLPSWPSQLVRVPLVPPQLKRQPEMVRLETGGG
jgi:hypothetical protein